MVSFVSPAKTSAVNEPDEPQTASSGETVESASATASGRVPRRAKADDNAAEPAKPAKKAAPKKKAAAPKAAAPKPVKPTAKPAEEPTAKTAEKPAEETDVPATPPAAEAAPTQAPSRADEQGGGLRVVVAEDEALIRLDLAEMLEGAGYEVVGQAPDGQQAVDLVRELRPDLVVMDVKMPVLDGISAAEIVGSEHLAPVVMLTAFSDKNLVERARDAGVMAYVVKPFTIDDLRPAIDIARSRWDEVRALEAEIADLGDRLETRKAVDRAKGVLMTQLKLSEPDAFRWIQKTAMDRRLGMREVAEAVITGLPGKR